MVLIFHAVMASAGTFQPDPPPPSGAPFNISDFATPQCWTIPVFAVRAGVQFTPPYSACGVNGAYAPCVYNYTFLGSGLYTGLPELGGVYIPNAVSSSATPSQFSVSAGGLQYVIIQYTVTTKPLPPPVVPRLGYVLGSFADTQAPTCNYFEIGIIPAFSGPEYFGDWDYIQIPPVPLVLSMVDPIADGLASGTDIVNNPAQVAAATHTVMGVAADSATQVVVRVTGVNVGDTVQLVLSDEDGPTTDASGAGYLSTLPASGITTVNSGGTLNVTAVDAGDGTGIALAVYTAPSDFVRVSDPEDAQSKLRSVSIQATDESTGTTTTQPVSIVRPPVVLVHGIWGQTQDFSGADGGVWQALENQSLFTIFGAPYNFPVAVSSMTPSYIVSPSTVRGSTLGYKFGATTILPAIQNIVTAYKSLALIVAGAPDGGSIAAVQVDVVAHSMGGDVTRTLPGIPGYADQKTYYHGYVHKLITLDTPHQGTPLAPQLLLQTNTQSNGCVRNTLGLFDNRYAFLSVTSKTAGTVSGAVGDLQPASAAIKTMQAATGPPIPTAMIGGLMSTAQLAGAGRSTKALILKALCPTDPMALSLNAATWPSVVGAASDAIVPWASQFDGQTAYSTGANTFQAVHSLGAEALGFGAPSILDQASSAPAEVLMLLNTPVSSTAIFEEKP